MKRIRKAFALFLCLVMCLSLFPASAFAEGDAAEEAADPVILSDSEGSQNNEPPLEGEVAAEKPEGSVPLSPAEGGTAPLAGEPEDEPVRVLFVSEPAELTLTVYTLGEDEEKQEIEPEDDGSYLLMPGKYYYDASCEGYAPSEKAELIVEASEAPLRVELRLAPTEELLPLTPDPDALDPDLLSDSVAELQSVVASGTCGSNMTWTLDDAGTLTVSGQGWLEVPGEYDDYGAYTFAPWKDLRDQILRIVIQPGVTGIYRQVFVGCSNVTEVSIPDTVRSIGVYNFYGCSSLTSIYIPDSVTSIGLGCFAFCSSLSQVHLPENLTCIDGAIDYHGVFAGCISLQSITLPASLESIDGQAFRGCSGLTSVVLPEKLTKIENEAFRDCTGLTSITVPAGLTTIYRDAFIGCTGLKDVYFNGSNWQKYARTGNGWASSGNDALFNATWHYAQTEHTGTIHSFAELKAIVEDYDGTETYVYYNDTEPFVFEESIALPEKLYFCADAEGSTVRIPEGVELFVKSLDENAFYAENLVVEGTLFIHVKKAVSCSTLTGKLTYVSGSCGRNAGYMYDPVTGAMRIYGAGYVSQNISLNPRSITVEYGIIGFKSDLVYISLAQCSNLTEVSFPSTLESAVSLPLTVKTIRFAGKYVGLGVQGATATVYYPAGDSSWDGVVGNHFGGNLTWVPVDVQPERSGTWGSNIFWALDDSGTLTISGEGSMRSFTSHTENWDEYSVAPPWDAFRDSINRIVIEDGVTYISRNAFQGYSALTSVSIPASVTGCGHYIEARYESAFGGQSGLITAGPSGSGCNMEFAWTDTIPDGVFYGCESLTSITIPASITKIEDSAFTYCNALKDVFFAGTRAQKDALLENCSNYGNNPLFSATWHCVDDPLPSGTFTVSDVTAPAGKTATVELSLSENPGITYLRLIPDYDTSKLELIDISADGSCLGAGWTLNPETGTCVWMASDNVSAAGKLLSLTFRVKDDVEEGPVTVGLKSIEANDEEEKDVFFLSEAGTITVRHRLPGDPNGDGEVNGKDVTRLARYLAGYAVELNAWNADVNWDGVVNGKDLTRLARFLADFDVVLE